jgi:signal transduction histidine kinase
MSRVRGFDLVAIDWAIAALLAIGAVADGTLLDAHPRPGLAIVSCVVAAGSVAWRRRRPTVTTLVAVTALLGFLGVGRRELVNGTALALADVAVMLNFYLLGRRARGRDGLLAAGALLAYVLGAFAAISATAHSASVVDVLVRWIPVVALFSVGRTLGTRTELTRELEAAAARLKDEQELRARRAAGEERGRMARELHDVIAHCVSVMVVQTSAARRVVAVDLEAARDALHVVESSGREALVELRRIVGVLRHGSDELAGFGLWQIDPLVERARAAGLPVELHVEGSRDGLTPGLDRVAYRVVQEALTNAIKHAGTARAEVTVSIGPRELELAIADTGLGAAPAGANGTGAGHGLVGMRERVTLYGGELHAAPRAGGGFEVRARIPLEGANTRSRISPEPPERPVAAPAAGGLPWPWLDPALVGVFLVAFEIEAVTSSYRRGALVLNLLALAALALVITWRRRRPLLFLLASGAIVDALSGGLTSLHSLTVAGSYTVLVLPYTVAAWEDRRRAAAGLAIWICGAALDGILGQGSAFDFLGATLSGTAVWAVGRAIRSRRALIAELRRTSARLAAEREDRERLAVAGERSRIARELHAVVAGAVAAMVVQAEAAQSLLGADPPRADATMGAIEDTGRDALAEMRRILGVLRHRGGEREPQPGVDQIYALIERGRARGQLIELNVDGEPGTLPAGVNLGLYRILEDALEAVRPAEAVSVTLRFGEDYLELHLTGSCQGPSGWPTEAMRERIALCGGELESAGVGGGWDFIARMPRGAQGALA